MVRSSDSRPGANSSLQLLSVQDLAALLRVSPRTIYRLRSEGKLPEPLKIGRSVRFRRSDIEQLIASSS